jgi:hypothetical protein
MSNANQYKIIILTYCIQNVHVIAWDLLKYNSRSKGTKSSFLDFKDDTELLRTERETPCFY